MARYNQSVCRDECVSAKFSPAFDENGLITAIAQDAGTGKILMAACMNKGLLRLTMKSGYNTYHSRPLKEPRKKGEESGRLQKIEQVLVGFDQDCLVLRAAVNASQCRASYQSCSCRALRKYGAKELELIAERACDPEETD